MGRFPGAVKTERVINHIHIYSVNNFNSYNGRKQTVLWPTAFARISSLRLLYIIVIALTCASLVKQIAAQASPDTRSGILHNITSDQQGILPLETARPVERDMGPGSRHAYQVELNQGQYLRVTVEQKNVDVSIQVTGPDGRLRARMDSPYGLMGIESVSTLADQTGKYIVEVLSVAQSPSGGRYIMAVEPARDPLPLDLKRIEAEKAFTEAKELRSQGKLTASAEKHKESLTYWAETGDLYWQAKALYALGSVYFALVRRRDAIDAYKQALSIQESIKDERGQAHSLKELGYAVGLEGLLVNSIEYSKNAVTIWRKENDLVNLADTLNNLGVAYGYLGEPHEALSHHNQAFQIREGLSDRSGTALSLNNIGLVYDNMGEPQVALDYYDRALTKLREIKNPSRDDRSREGATLNNMGFLYASLAEPQLALDYYEQALPIRREVKDTLREGTTLSNMGNAYLAMGDTQKALDYYDKALAKQNEAGNAWAKAYTFMNIGNALATINESQKTLDHYEQALKIFKDVPDYSGEAAALDKIGRVYISYGKFNDAESSLKQALALWQKVEDRYGEITTLETLARNERARHNLAESQRWIEKSIDLIESLRTGILNPQLRTSYFASVRDCYELGIDILMQLHRVNPAEGYDRKALQMSERSRSRVLLELLNESRRVAVKTEDGNTLLKRRYVLDQQLNAKANRQLQLLRGKASEEQKRMLDQEIRSLLGQIESLDTQMRKENPRFAAFTKPQLLEAEAIQRLLDPGTMILEYALGDNRSYLWMITEKSIKSFELPGQAEIDALAQRFYSLLTAPNIEIKGESAQQKSSRINDADRNYTQVASKLSQILLEPVAPFLGTNRLIIIPDGKLQLLPFAALSIPTSLKKEATTGGQISHGVTIDATYQPLIINHEIIRLFSASVLSAARAETQRRPLATKALALLGDPVYTRDDTRFAIRKRPSQALSQQLPLAELKRTVKGIGEPAAEFSLDRLFFSIREIQSIAAAASVGQIKKAVGFDASRDLVLSDELSHYKVIHFAAHGLLNDKHPELSGLVLSLFDRQGHEQNGYLTLADVFRLDLNADLVVLSACGTALGREVKGEGLIGLTRGFMYAGAARVVASLWNADDAATADLMAHFYKRMLRDGERPAEALRSAQIEMWKQKRWLHPYYWAAFVLQGEWR